MRAPRSSSLFSWWNEWAAPLWIGCNFSAWMRLLIRNRFAVHWSRWHFAIMYTLLSVVHSCLGFLQKAIFGRRVANTVIADAPIFIVGHWRTGTTLLHELLTLDERHTGPTSYECLVPHHFLLTEEHVGFYNTNAKMCPPLRSAADRDAMIEAILDGVVDAIATDHAPHAVHEKEVEFENAPNGITGLETALGLCLRWLHKEWKMPLGRVLSLLSAQPAALLGLKGRGTLAAGSFADVVVFDPKAEWSYRAAESRSKSRNTPFDGFAMQGRVRWTISEGRIAYAAAEK